MTGDGDNFISRWSRRKIEARKAEADKAPSIPPAAPEPPGVRPGEVPAASQGARDAAEPAAAPLPPLDSLRGVASEYRDFLRPEVDEGLRREALKKLFHDPHFNVMDGLDTYIDDYSKPDPIPEAMLRSLNHAKGLIFDREDEPQEAAAPAVDERPAPPDELPCAETDEVPGEGGGEVQGEQADSVPVKPTGAA